MTTHLRVLILEDRPDHAELMVRQLRSSGFAPEWIRADTEASFLAALSTSPDLVLADYNLPQYGGIQALQTLKAMGLDIPCILVSGTVGEELAVASLQEGATDYLLKDRLARLGHAVTRALDRTRLLRERAQAEMARARLAAVVESSDDAIVALTLSGTILTWNRGAGSMFGHASDEIVGRPVVDLVAAEHAAELTDAVARVAQGEPAARRDTVGAKRDGTTFHLSATLSPIPGKDQRTREISAVFRDVTVEKRAQEILRSHAREQEVVAYLGRWALNGAPVAELLRDGAALIARALGASRCMIFGVTEEPDLLALRGAAGSDVPIGRPILAVREGSFAHRVLRRAGGVVVDAWDPEWTTRLWLRGDQAATAAGVAIRRGSTALGMLVAVFPPSRTLEDSDAHFLQAVAHMLVDIVVPRPAAAEATVKSSKGTASPARSGAARQLSRPRRRRKSARPPG